jgi:2-keto-4-pentenoate hydratase/2-oxohepta-3-ene-1,7-dioic acid hydratase in catechol pathway
MGAKRRGPETETEGMPRGLTLCTLRRDGQLSLGVRTPRGVVDVARSAAAMRVRAPADVQEAIEGRHASGLRRILAAAEAGKRVVLQDEDEVAFGPCVTRPEKIVMMGLNYRKHCAEIGLAAPSAPVFFNKYNNALLGHRGAIPLPVKVASQFDYEGELVVVIGRTARDVSPADAPAHVFGYCVGNDFSARDLQMRTSQFMAGKTCDGFAPIGPWLVAADLVGDPQDLAIETRVNGEVRQSSRTSDMIFSCADLVSEASRIMTLRPGDLVFTGTPEGVIQGKPEAQRVWLRAGDSLTTTIEKLGTLEFTLS